MNSILIKIFRKGKNKDLEFPKKENKKIIIKFKYANTKKKYCKVIYILKFKKNRPRDLVIKINNKEFKRKVDKNYNQSFITESKKIKIIDPLHISIKKFVDYLNNIDDPLVSENEILDNLSLQKEIINKYEKS